VLFTKYDIDIVKKEFVYVHKDFQIVQNIFQIFAIYIN